MGAFVQKVRAAAWLAVVVAAASTKAAGAADMAVKAPPPAVLAPVDWTEFNVGDQTGYAAGSSASTASALAGGLSADQQSKAYTLFNPTPENLMRELMTDRPDNTESPFTVDPGHLQFETTLFGYARSYPDADGNVTDSEELGTTNVRLGLTNSSEVNAIWQPYGMVQTHAPDPANSMRQSGIGGLEIRAKINLWGNDTFETPGATALGLLPYISLPTARGNGVSPDAVEGGFILPYAIKLTEKFDLGLNAGIEAVHNDDTSGYRPEYLASASLGQDWTEKLSGYYEFFGQFNTPRGNAVILATGLTYQVTKNLQFDTGINFGVTNAADRFNPFVGVSSRF
jgi:Putative MetA-pathway of phenol degradation